MRRPSRNRPAGAPHEQAIDWLAREDEGRLTPDEQAQLRAWLDADPARPALYARARAAVGAPNLYSAHPEMMEMRSAALAALGQRRPRRSAWAAVAAAAAVVVLGSGWAALSPDTSPRVSRLEQAAAPLTPRLNPNAAIYETAVGERTSVKLPDGSVAILNTDSLVKVAYTGRERGVRLVRGQALFEVAHNKRRPFQVYAGDRRITALGTTFDVRLDEDEVKVTLVDGVVRVARVAAAAPPAQQVTMTAGELLEAGPSAAMTVRPVDVAARTSWQSGVLVFKSQTLAEAVAEVNRYTDRPLAIADPAIAGYRVTGVFRAGDPARFAAAVTEVLPVEIQPERDGSLTLREKL